jgi:hypothetical protein
MSLCISVVTPEGIVLAGDSRQTAVTGGISRIATDTGVKVFRLTRTVLAATAGWAFLRPKGEVLPRNISSFIDDFRVTIPADASVQEVSDRLWAYFKGIYEQHIAEVPKEAQLQGGVALNFLVTGYDPGTRVGKLFGMDIPSSTAPTNPSRTSTQPGPWWIGQVDVVARLMNGYDPLLITIPPVQAAHQAGTALQQLSALYYVVSWSAMTVQDAIDFAVGLIQITTTIQKFTAGTVLKPGGVPGVGGPIDVAVILPGGTVEWLSRKQLHS